MAVGVDNLVYQFSTTTGTGNITLSAMISDTPSQAFRNFSDAFGTGSGNTFYYAIRNRAISEYEVGIGYMSDTTTMVRQTIIQSSNSNNAVNFSAGTKDVINDIPASRQVDTAFPPLASSSVFGFSKVDNTTITATGGVLSTVGGVTTTGTPASGNLVKFSGSGTITNGDLAGVVSTSGSLATTFGSFTSATLAAALSDETGTGVAVFSASPALSGSPTAPTQTPSDNSTKLATTAYVDAAIISGPAIDACKYATVSALAAVTYSNGSSGVGATLTGVSVGALSVDGVTPSLNDRVLVKNQVSTFQNGIYSVTVVGSVGAPFVLTRTTDYNQSADIDIGDTTFISAGNTLANTTWAQNGTTDPTIGTDPITFTQTAGVGSFTAGNGISITGASIAIDTSVTVDKTTVQTLSNKTFVAPALGTPISGVATNLTGTASGLTAGLVTNGVYTTDTGTVTNTMLAGSIANAKLTNSSVTVNGTAISLGASGTVTAAAGTLTGTTLNSTVVTSSLTALGTVTTGTWNGTTVDVPHGGTGAVSLTSGTLLIGNGASPISAPTALNPTIPGANSKIITNGSSWTTSGPVVIISSGNLSGSGASVIFSSFPQGFSFLRLVVTSAQFSATGQLFSVKLSTSGSTGHSYTQIRSSTAAPVLNSPSCYTGTAQATTSGSTILMDIFGHQGGFGGIRYNCYGSNNATTAGSEFAATGTFFTTWGVVVIGNALDPNLLSSITVTGSGGNFSGGTYVLYGVL